MGKNFIAEENYKFRNRYIGKDEVDTNQFEICNASVTI
jgi:hypothetical protein